MDAITEKLKKYFETKNNIKTLQQQRNVKINGLKCDNGLLTDNFYKPKASCDCDRCNIIRMYHNKIHNNKMICSKILVELKKEIL